MWFRCPVEIADETYVVISTRVASGESVSGRARVVPLSDGRLGLWSADVLVADGQPIAVRSEHTDAELRGTVELVRSGRAYDETRAKLRRKYGLRGRLRQGDSVLLVRLDDGGRGSSPARLETP